MLFMVKFDKWKKCRTKTCNKLTMAHYMNDCCKSCAYLRTYYNMRKTGIYEMAGFTVHYYRDILKEFGFNVDGIDSMLVKKYPNIIDTMSIHDNIGDK